MRGDRCVHAFFRERQSQSAKLRGQGVGNIPGRMGSDLEMTRQPHWLLPDKLQRHLANSWQVTSDTKKISSQAEQKNYILSNLTERRRKGCIFRMTLSGFSLGQIWSQRVLTPQDFSSCHQPCLWPLEKPSFRLSGVGFIHIQKEQIKSYHDILDNS